MITYVPLEPRHAFTTPVWSARTYGILNIPVACRCAAATSLFDPVQVDGFYQFFQLCTQVIKCGISQAVV